MMRNYEEHLIPQKSEVRVALERLNHLATDAIIFIVDQNQKLIGSLTDGDIRRGLINGLNTDNVVDDFIQPNPKFIHEKNYDINELIKLRDAKYNIIPVLNDSNQVVDIVNFRFLKSYLPMDTVIMAGGRGSRLQPLTDDTPKPLLKIAEKPILEYGIDRLQAFGVTDFWISVRYLGEQIESYFGNGKDRGVNIKYLWENEPLGTIGAISQIKEFKHDYVLITNSDILTTIDYEDFFLDFKESGADLAIASIPYQVDIPYAVLETDDNKITAFSEKPTYTYFSNGGIYLVKTELLKKIPENTFYNSTDFMEKLMAEGYHVVSYPLTQYWLDIGKHNDFNKAQKDVQHLSF